MVHSLLIQRPLERQSQEDIVNPRKKNPRTNNFKNNAKIFFVITIERFLIQNFANYRTMAEISTAKNRLPRSPTELEKDRPSFSSLVSLASACAMGDIAPLKSLKKKT